jgi:cell division protein FtsB
MKNPDFINILEACSEKIEADRFAKEGYRAEIERLLNENIELRKRIEELEKHNG